MHLRKWSPHPLTSKNSTWEYLSASLCRLSPHVYYQTWKHYAYSNCVVVPNNVKIGTISPSHHLNHFLTYWEKKTWRSIHKRKTLVVLEGWALCQASLKMQQESMLNEVSQKFIVQSFLSVRNTSTNQSIGQSFIRIKIW